MKHVHVLDNWRHEHDFAVLSQHGEWRTVQVLILTAVTMVVEIVAGTVYGSMALLADGWHMGTHVAAFAITIFAYRYARRNADNPAFAFGTGKVGVLGGFASAIALGVVALVMFAESMARLFGPQTIHFNEAIGVALLGLTINMVSAFLLRDHHHRADHHHQHDHNLRAAYLHVLADALTSVLAIVALICGKYFGWVWMDPIMGIVGAAVIARWSLGLVKSTGPVLVDESIDEQFRQAVQDKVEGDADNRITDLHIWKVGPRDYAAILSLVTRDPRPPDHYKALVAAAGELTHVTIEVNQCVGAACVAPTARSLEKPTAPAPYPDRPAEE